MCLFFTDSKADISNMGLGEFLALVSFVVEFKKDIYDLFIRSNFLLWPFRILFQSVDHRKGV